MFALRFFCGYQQTLATHILFSWKTDTYCCWESIALIPNSDPVTRASNWSLRIEIPASLPLNHSIILVLSLLLPFFLELYLIPETQVVSRGILWSSRFVFSPVINKHVTALCFIYCIRPFFQNYDVLAIVHCCARFSFGRFYLFFQCQLCYKKKKKKKTFSEYKCFLLLFWFCIDFVSVHLKVRRFEYIGKSDLLALTLFGAKYWIFN